MNKYILIIALFFTSCQNFEDNGNDDTSWELMKDSLNIAILVFDYDSTSFMGGALYRDSYNESLGDSLPLHMFYSNTVYVDGPIILKLNTPELGDTIFDYYYNPWGGPGVLSTPDTLINKSRFLTHEKLIDEPFYIETIESMKLNPSSDTFHQKREEIWQVAKQLDITREYARYDYQVFTCLLRVNNVYTWYLILCAVT